VLDVPVIKSLSKIKSDVDDDTTNLIASAFSGTATPNSTINIYDGLNRLGTTTANASGSWTFQTGPLSPGTHTFSATADLSGNTSAASNAIALTVEAIAPGTSRFGSFSSQTTGRWQRNVELLGGTRHMVVGEAAGDTSAVSTPFNVTGNQRQVETQVLAAALAETSSTSGVPSLSINDTVDHVINAAESTAVAFTVSGLEPGVTGAVTFNDASNHQVVVDVRANGTFSANLSGLTDGTITSVISATDSNGSSVSVAGNVISLDTDSSLQPALSVNAANPTDVKFVVSGLESDYSGTVTFTDATGKSDVVAIGSNGTYSADLSNLTDGALTYVMTVSDPAGNIITVDPTTTLGSLPAGVTLQQIDGGPNYYGANGFTNAANAGWDNPNFFPVGPWSGFYTNQTNVNTFKTLDWNTSFNVTGNSSAALARANGISLIQDINNGLLAGTGSETVGLISHDEPSTFALGVSTPLGTTPNSVQDGRFWYMNDTWNWIVYGGLSPIGPSSPAYVSSAQVLNSLVTTPDGTQVHIDASSLDIYWFAGVVAPGAFNASSVLGVSNATADQIERGSNYGYVIAQERLATGGNTPVYGIVETGGPYTEDTSASDYITPPELNWAVWSELINGARGIVYFDCSFAGPGASNDNAESSYYQTVQPGQTVSIDTQIQNTDALIAQLAPVLNSPTALGYVTVSPAPQEFSGIETMVKDNNGQFYIFADTRDSLTQTNIPATFTIADLNATSVTVVGENRSIPVVNGVFSDTFATAATVHIYGVVHVTEHESDHNRK